MTTTLPATFTPSGTPSTATPGERFARAVIHTGALDMTVPVQAYLPAEFPLFERRPRYTVRHLIRVCQVADESVPFVREEPGPSPRRNGSSPRYETTPEAGYLPMLRSVELSDLRVDVPLPAGLLAHPGHLAAYVDYRVLVRMGVRENQTLLHGSADGVVTGLLNTPGLRRGPRSGIRSLLASAAAVEETGGSCDGIVAHPVTYWRIVEAGLLDTLGKAGVRVSRTRMMPRGQVLLGDFRAAATFFDPRVASLTLRRGAGPHGGDSIEASSRFGFAVQLPQHLMLVELDDDR